MQEISANLPAQPNTAPGPFHAPHLPRSFKSVLDKATSPAKDVCPAVPKNPSDKISLYRPSDSGENIQRHRATAAYRHQAPAPEQENGWQKYKDDQLLSNPGGDSYDLEQKKMMSPTASPPSFFHRIGKDLSDGMACLSNGFKDLLFGANRHYRNNAGQIQEVKKGGVLTAIGGFFKNLGSALTFGQWHPDQKTPPRGVVQRCNFAFSKLKQAVMGNLIQGVGGSAIQAGEDFVLAGWNLIETVPDATIGNMTPGRKLTTAVFDNGQVMIDYLTDIVPTGEAWLRVHAYDLKKLRTPITYNINIKEHYDGDERWRYVRNTPFRKTIETIGSLLADAVSVKLFSNTQFTSEEQKAKKTT